ncbi:MAG: CBU_0592 family membrane protein [Gammaproteobacteria bacterium]
MIVQGVSLLGAALILTAFTLQQLQRWQAQDWSYLWANAIGAGALTGVAWLESQWGFLLMETVWTLVSVHGLLRKYRGA